MLRKRLSVAVAALVMVGGVSARAQLMDLRQGWDDATRDAFWFGSQGSRIMPYAWFIALEQASSQELLRAPAFMESLGYIVVGASPANPNNLPIGFARDENKTATASYAGLTCAACHTTRLLINSRKVIVEGGPAMADFTGLLNAVVDSTAATIADAAKFSRFAARVGAQTSQAESQLKAGLVRLNAELAGRRDLNAPSEPYGFGRVDAFGHIFNTVFASGLGVPANAAKPDAPVSYPFLWDTPQHDRVQWNGSAPNEGLLGLGALFRNIGELLGVFGQFDLAPRPLVFPYYADTSVRQSKLTRLEGLVRKLRSPLWPVNVLPIDTSLAALGQPVYGAQCARCHVILDRTNPRRMVEAQLFEASAVGTDDTMTKNFLTTMNDRVFSTGMLNNRVKSANVLDRFDATAKGAEIFTHVLVGVWAGQLVSIGGGFGFEGVTARRPQNLDTEVPRPVYKARPLNGVWATAPFLHNGSVPSLRELLKPASQRVSGFWIGAVAFDPDAVGLSSAGGPPSFWFDASKPGNRNSGHEYGVGLSEPEKRALLEYLKTL